MSDKLEYLFWGLMGKKSALLFGEECGSAAVWMIVVLCLKSIVYYTGVAAYIPHGFIFAFPLLIQLLAKFFPFLISHFPILPVRITQAMLGRLSPTKLLMVIPAHFLGCVVGVVIFSTLLPFIPPQALETVKFSQCSMRMCTLSLIFDSAMLFLYCTAVTVVPELLRVNKMSTHLLSLVLLPVMAASGLARTGAFHPTALYALWFINRSAGGPSMLGSLLGSSASSPTSEYCSAAGGNSSSDAAAAASCAADAIERDASPEYSPAMNSFPLLQIVTPLAAALAAGLFCSMFFPDSPSSWKRKANSL